MADLNQDDDARVEVVTNSPVIAIVGRSNDHYYSSYQVGEYLEKHGFTVYNVNPNIDEIDGERSYPSLADVPEPIDLVCRLLLEKKKKIVAEQAALPGATTDRRQLDDDDTGRLPTPL